MKKITNYLFIALCSVILAGGTAGCNNQKEEPKADDNTTINCNPWADFTFIKDIITLGTTTMTNARFNGCAPLDWNHIEWFCLNDNDATIQLYNYGGVIITPKRTGEIYVILRVWNEDKSKEYQVNHSFTVLPQ
ncbi:MAG: hypothetical protein FWD66_10105 [Paludibacter sp.]|nr:hypothetical protein [Paludibacter sp.]